jgi:hypothetical protein
MDFLDIILVFAPSGLRAAPCDLWFDRSGRSTEAGVRAGRETS